MKTLLRTYNCELCKDTGSVSEPAYDGDGISWDMETKECPDCSFMDMSGSNEER